VLAAPGELELVRTFVNTRDLELGIERLATPADLDAVLGVTGSSAADLERAIAFREALRALLLANATGEAPPRAAAARVAAAGPLTVDEDLRPAGDGLARLLAVVVHDKAAGTWARLKACPGKDCQWALYDHTRSRTRRWCAGAKCGARTRSRSYRARRAATSGEAR
jgi:predicted RNA-binding Zn ribbon-like protein